MKKFFKWFFIIIMLIVIAGGAWYVYDNYIAKRTIRNHFSLVPEDAVFIVETTNLSEAWTEISKSNIWKNLLNSKTFEDINEYAGY